VYYEVECVSVASGVAQVGFGDEEFDDLEPDSGVGDDAHSWGFDGNRMAAWGAGGSKFYGQSWKDGDVLGCAADLGVKTIQFFLNGESMGVTFEGVNIKGQLRAAITANGQKLRIHLDKRTWKFPQNATP